MMTSKEKAQQWGISERSVRTLCNDERIPGAIKVGKGWQIPDDAEKPEDGRVKTGAYRKKDGVSLKMG